MGFAAAGFLAAVLGLASALAAGFFAGEDFFAAILASTSTAATGASITGSAATTGSTATYSGNYIWYVDDEGKVQSMYKHFPDSKGYQDGVFP